MMINLGDFIGNLLNDIAWARYRGDIETLRIAEIYANNDLLKHFSVPRFRLPDIKIDLPVIIEDPGGTEKLGLKQADVIKSLKKNLSENMEKHGIKLKPSEEKVYYKNVSDGINRLLAAIPLPQNIIFAKKAKEYFYDMKPKVEKERLERALQDFQVDFINELNVIRAKGAGIKVITTTAHIKEMPDPDMLFRMNLSVSEEAVEWTVIETASGEEVERLIQE